MTTELIGGKERYHMLCIGPDSKSLQAIMYCIDIVRYIYQLLLLILKGGKLFFAEVFGKQKVNVSVESFT